MTDRLPPLPPGFVLEPQGNASANIAPASAGVPALPPGFVLEPVEHQQAPPPPMNGPIELANPMASARPALRRREGFDPAIDEELTAAGAIGATGRLLANGATFGQADKFAGAMNALTGQAGSYDEGVRAERAKTQGLRDEAPILAGSTEAVGGLLTGAGLMRQGFTLAGKVGAGLLPRMAAFGAEGAGYGAAHGAGNTYSDNIGDYASNAGTGALWGGVIGAGLPLAGSAASTLYRGGQAVSGPAIEGTGRMASALLRGGALADEAGLRSLQQMGPEAMMVDAGPSMLGLGQGAGTGTGQGRTELVNALRARDAGTGQRLAGVLDETLGPAPVPSQVRAGLDVSRGDIGRRYDHLDFDNPVDTQGLADALDETARRIRGPAQGQVRKVRGYLDEVPDPAAPPSAGDGPTLSRDASTLFETRNAIDGLLSTEVDPKAIRQLTIARQSVDEELQHSVPGIKQVDGQFEEIARQDEGLTRGGQIFDTGKTATRPVELAQEIQQGALPAGEMVGPSGVPFRMRQGARAEVDRLVGTHVNDLNTLERTLATPQDWNSQKFAAMFGEPQYETVAGALRNNRQFRQSYQDIVQGSQTAQRTAAQKSMDGEIDIPLDTTAMGVAANSGRAIWKALVGLSNEATKDEIGRILAKQGPDAVRIMEALLARSQSTREGSRAVVRSVANPAYVGAAGQISGQRQSR